MVALLHLLYASVAVFITTLPVLANPTPAELSASQSPADIVHSLFVHPLARRETIAPINVDNLPDQCKSPCKTASDKFTVR
ncbi:hypothetical protein DXG03_001276 [Asterophora parasitica]|uniref:Uncharacterized protein n=1 Tax=Asterophora parasitica TaxID=117018 RepID=A0A9P7G551_9AGAR|nr:hypothetical protein DXG03_001276 [Asterophora parasitica]